ncbi:F-box domain-containing protein [Magnaporthiopsis poae ATCC 64411]|uniref:F-box domain-containing protein n=1 Tax=Magnaporthiopsis poae (strain ATCC 64411 / 73-15) TaxID=644358 RepID=A0A0C4E1T7_MAGP6|nr:F-box domain-containing protein [Magnaporthiopsis poae ATCC 64411]
MHVDKDGIAMSPTDSDMDDFDSAETSSTERALSTKPPALAGSPGAKMLKGKAKEWSSQRENPLTLLELPVDILRLIVKEITHTNDLTSLALTNSTLHTLATPHIYARFDIVWPDAHMTASDTKSVDALTYGLSTLSLGSSFSRIRQRLARQSSRDDGRPPFNPTGNNYALHTRKFSLGNGPQDWVAEYMITKESGKMLGTLVAMAVAKMANLETFVWDMPTGVLAEIFLALASLPDHHKDGECNLERVWIRWHDNSDATPDPGNPVTGPGPIVYHVILPNNSTMTQVGIKLPSNTNHPKPKPAIPYSASVVEYPTFSVLPPLKSLTVLDIDELAYLDEMAMLIERSQDRLKELRVGMSAKVQHKEWIQPWDGPDLQQVDHDAHWPGASTIGRRRLGGVLGTLVGRIYDIPRRSGTRSRGRPTPAPNHVSSASVPDADQPSVDTPIEQFGEAEPVASNGGGQPISDPLSEQPSTDSDGSKPQGVEAHSQSADQIQDTDGNEHEAVGGAGQRPNVSDQVQANGQPKPKTEAQGRERLEGKLRLHTLELERVSLSIQVCIRAFDWTTLTNLTILECAQHETLWKVLRTQFQPTQVSGGYGISSSSRQAATPHLQYRLCLKHLHTDLVSPSLIAFINETLAPNTLEVLFLQDRRRGPAPPQVTVDAIFRGALKRHRSSLRKLLLDSSARIIPDVPASSAEINRWTHWVLTTEMVLYITSGRMSKLRELAASLAYQDWHTFLQRLPNVAQLRSLNIPRIGDHIMNNVDPKELAMQIADIITLRPEIQLCYIGISTKCFEVLETPVEERSNSAVNGGTGSVSGSPVGENGTVGANNNTGGQQSDNESVVEAESDGEPQDETSEEEDDDETEDEDGAAPANAMGDADGTQSEGHSDAGDDSDDNDGFDDADYVRANTRLRLREILFYDDKVSIFKARHARL